MIVTWQTMHSIHGNHGAYVEFGRDKNDLKHWSKAEVSKFTEGQTKFYTYRALMSSLKPKHSYCELLFRLSDKLFCFIKIF